MLRNYKVTIKPKIEAATIPEMVITFEVSMSDAVLPEAPEPEADDALPEDCASA